MMLVSEVVKVNLHLSIEPRSACLGRSQKFFGNFLESFKHAIGNAPSKKSQCTLFQPQPKTVESECALFYLTAVLGYKYVLYIITEHVSDDTFDKYIADLDI